MKVATHVPFDNLATSLLSPAFVETDMFKSWAHAPPMLMHLTMQALASFQDAHNGELPRVWNLEDADEILSTVVALNKKLARGDEGDGGLMKRISLGLHPSAAAESTKRRIHQCSASYNR